MRKETTPDRLPGIDPGALSAPAIIYLAGPVPDAAKPRAISCPSPRASHLLGPSARLCLL